MIKAILVDDEEHCRESLSILLEEYCPQVKLLAACSSAQEALQIIETLKPALVFLDIEMPEMNGFEMLQQFEQLPFSVIFTTSYDQYAVKAFHFSALDYLMKPIDRHELVAAVNKLQEQGHRPLFEQFQLLLGQVRHKGEFKKIALPTLEGFELINIEEIIRFEADSNYTQIFLRNKNRITVCRALKEMEEQLQDFPYFMRVHHSYIVNLNEAKKYVRGEGGYLIMSDGSTVNISRSRRMH
jgi:two-component system LytT family response regulator